MRIVSGKYKRRNIQGYDLKGTRPTMERVKESLFAMIQNDLADSNCLDLFAGSGNLGFEALSQGARHVVLVDNNEKAIRTILENAKLLQVNEQVDVYKSDYLKALEQLKEEKFDIIFLDPPYATDYIELALNSIVQYQLLEKNGCIVLESNDINKLFVPEGFKKIKQKKYGDKYISIIKYEI